MDDPFEDESFFKQLLVQEETAVLARKKAATNVSSPGVALQQPPGPMQPSRPHFISPKPTPSASAAKPSPMLSPSLQQHQKPIPLFTSPQSQVKEEKAEILPSPSPLRIDASPLPKPLPTSPFPLLGASKDSLEKLHRFAQALGVRTSSIQLTSCGCPFSHFCFFLCSTRLRPRLRLN